MNVAFEHQDHCLAGVLAKTQLGPGIAVAACDPRQDHGVLWPAEQKTVNQAVEARRLEFKAGRFAARQAMKDLGLARAPIPSGPDRGPIWPKGVTGSISHCQSACIAAVARTRDVRSIGVDIEPATALDGNLLDIVCTCTEQAWLASQPSGMALKLAKLIFSAKESVYKAQFPLSRKILDFHGLSLDIDLKARTFTALFCQNVMPFLKGHRLSGQFSIAGGLIVTTVVLRSNELVGLPGCAAE